LRKVEVVKAEEVDVEPLEVQHFVVEKREGRILRTVSKKELKKIAESLGLVYNDAQINFAKKLMNAYMKKEIK